MTSAEFESAVNDALLSGTVSDNTRTPIVTEEGALAITAVWACVRILSETISSLPIHLYKRTEKGREKITSSTQLNVLNRPNEYSGRYALLQHLMIGCTLWGNGYARIYRDKKYRPERILFLHPTEIEPILTHDDHLFYRDSTGLFLPPEDIIHLKGVSTNGYKGLSPIQVHRLNLGLAV